MVVVLAAVAYFAVGQGSSTPQTSTTPQTPSTRTSSGADVKVEEVPVRGARKNPGADRDRVTAEDDPQGEEASAADQQTAKRRGDTRNKPAGRRTESAEESDDFRDAKPTRGMLPGPG